MAAAVVAFDRTASSAARRVEAALVFVFGVGVAGSGIGGFFGHFLLPDVVADSIGWAQGSPFQLEMAFANLALGVLGMLAAQRRDGFREATVIAVTVVGVGATIVHVTDYLATGNAAPGNTLQNAANLIKPAFLIPLLVASRRIAPADGTLSSPALDAWRSPLVSGAYLTTAIVGTTFGVGFTVGEVETLSILGAAIAIAVTGGLVARSRMLSEERS